jgi:ninein
LDSENTELSQKNSQNQEDLQDLNQRLAAVLRQKEKEPGNSSLEEWEQEKSNLKKELERHKVQVWSSHPTVSFFLRNSKK